MKIIGALSVALTGAMMMVAIPADAQTKARTQYEGAAAAIVDGKGNMHVPAAYRTTFQMLGTWAVAADSGAGSKEMHTVYARLEALLAETPDSAEGWSLLARAYRKQGREADAARASARASTLAGLPVADNIARARAPASGAAAR